MRSDFMNKKRCIIKICAAGNLSSCRLGGIYNENMKFGNHSHRGFD